ncbi:hypothetical protein J2S50_007122 [Streptomyces sp. DSM 40167]|nr:hypothetical protein [Streptomyces sp. DSM 40167]
MTRGVVSPGPRGAVTDADQRPDHRPAGRNARPLRAAGLHTVDARERPPPLGPARCETCGGTVTSIDGVGIFRGLDVGKQTHHGHGLTPAGKTVFGKPPPHQRPVRHAPRRNLLRTGKPPPPLDERHRGTPRAAGPAGRLQHSPRPPPAPRAGGGPASPHPDCTGPRRRLPPTPPRAPTHRTQHRLPRRQFTSRGRRLPGTPTPRPGTAVHPRPRTSPASPPARPPWRTLSERTSWFPDRSTPPGRRHPRRPGRPGPPVIAAQPCGRVLRPGRATARAGGPGPGSGTGRESQDGRSQPGAVRGAPKGPGAVVPAADAAGPHGPLRAPPPASARMRCPPCPFRPPVSRCAALRRPGQSCPLWAAP